MAGFYLKLLRATATTRGVGYGWGRNARFHAGNLAMPQSDGFPESLRRVFPTHFGQSIGEVGWSTAFRTTAIAAQSEKWLTVAAHRPAPLPPPTRSSPSCPDPLLSRVHPGWACWVKPVLRPLGCSKLFGTAARRVACFSRSVPLKTAHVESKRSPRWTLSQRVSAGVGGSKCPC
jgi:hypothetical protein